MKNLQMSLARLLKNKNTVTILGALAIILIVYVAYKIQVNKAVSPVPNIPIAAETIQPRTKITSEMISYMDMASTAVQDNVYRTAGEVIGKYSNYNTIIPAGSMFFHESIVAEDKLPDAAFVEVPKGEIPYNFPVDIDSTYGNSIFPGNYIDIYMKAEDETGKLMVGRLIENVKVLAVKDGEGNHVFENTTEARTPAFLIFSLDAEKNILLRKASYMYSFAVELFPVPHGTEIKNDEKATVVSSQRLQDFINANTIANDEIKAKAEAEEAQKNKKNTNKNKTTKNKTTENLTTEIDQNNNQSEVQ